MSAQPCMHSLGYAISPGYWISLPRMRPDLGPTTALALSTTSCVTVMEEAISTNIAPHRLLFIILLAEFNY